MPHSVSPDTGSSGDHDLPDANPQSSHSTPTIRAGESPEEAEKSSTALEDMFDDDDDDLDDLSSSMAASQEPQSVQAISGAQSARFSDPEIMRAFYQRLFPFRYLFQWLNHSPSPSTDFGHREFAFTLPNDAYLRYQSFPSSDLLRKQCIQMLPSRFEVGPVYSTNPRDRKTLRKSSAFRPLNKELVFDIDMTDYDEIRTCCTGANICHRCWAFITMAIKVIDTALREDFGFKHILWVYSGRRGAHAWVCDKRARELDDSKRRAVAGYLELLKGGDSSGKKVNLKRPLHPHIERSLRILRNHFSDILETQDPWLEDDRAAHLLSLLPDRDLVAALRKRWDSAPGRRSGSKWADIDALAEARVSEHLDSKALLEAKIDIVLEYTYPRLDAEVSKKLNHLLKSPFCVHPGTGRVCVPIDVQKVEEFDPLEVPTVTQLLDDIDQWDHDKMDGVDGEGTGEKKIQDWEKTRLKPYVEQFRNFVSELLKDERAIKRERDDADPMEF
ncbi:prim-pol domain-containing protein [Eremomyces bilateralis CBS 781.70]|uniref:DNA primase n=1 Tax=Eremomyces bilateralis CBS 781.70 TaxID=1392243 RepID=A0A6G1FTE8_9PEZI|nr:prim-pol domain-containing protein [Eremomyces bilateralis CBS 781.70]KAF1809067.1 prim-pol domain-containing protein [Eremomyces bilateralis CBS 781.70]